ncbi:MAG: histidine kinase [Sulfurovum sp.]|nr:MAG: histidine kinase [Sulfurovum sp.]
MSFISAVGCIVYFIACIFDVLLIPQKDFLPFFIFHAALSLGTLGIGILAYRKIYYKLIVTLVFISFIIAVVINLYLSSLGHAFYVSNPEIYLIIFVIFIASGVLLKEAILAVIIIDLLFIFNLVLYQETSSAEMFFKLLWLFSANLISFICAILLHRSNRIIFQQQEALNLEINNKEILLKELFHRVKNNLQIVSGVLHIQSKKVEDESAKEVLSNSIQIIKSMGLIHEKIYTSVDLEFINFQEYLNSLIRTMVQLEKGKKVEFSIVCSDILISLKNAVPLGLIVNEIITNSLKHAFNSSNQQQMKITIEVDKNDEDELRLKIFDNGKGIQLDKLKKSFGFRLIESLSSFQLRGSLEYFNIDGFGYILKFKDV